MRKVLFQMMVTLDGFFEGPHHEIDWHVVDDEFNQYAWEMCSRADTLVFGRVTYQLMADFWPSAQALRDDPVTADWMNRLDKVVFSHTLNKVSWQNTRLVKTDPVDEVARLKSLPGKNIAILGSSDLSLPLLKAGLIDEYRIMINPVVLGSGKRLFSGLEQRLNLKLTGTKVFHSGLVGLFYASI
jgi:dihydrofolate reductase